MLIDALDRNQNLHVKLLIPYEDKMDDSSKHKFNAHKTKFDALTQKYGERFQLRRYDTVAHHSFVMADNDIIIGPIFPNTESQNSPAIHFDINSIYASKYQEYFVKLWKDHSQV